MTPRLALLIQACTCKRCAGEGKLVSSQVTRTVFGPLVRNTWTDECAECGGTGVQSMGDDDDGPST